MKKILSLVLALTLFIVAIPISAFADTTSTDGLFGVIVDENGNIVERLPMSKALFVNSIYTIEPGHSFISFQYEPNNIFFGFSTNDGNGNNITPRNTRFRLSLEASNSIGEGKEEMCYYYFDIKYNSYANYLDYGGSEFYEVEAWEPKYWNCVIKNESSIATSVRVVIVLNTADYFAELYRYFPMVFD